MRDDRIVKKAERGNFPLQSSGDDGIIVKTVSLPGGTRVTPDPLSSANKPESPAPRFKLLSKIKEYLQPRPTTTGDLPYSSPKQAAIMGGIQGAFTGGPSAGVGGLAAGYAGVRIGEETESVGKALLGSTVIGAGATLLAASLLAIISGGMGIPIILATAGLIGAGGGTAGSLISKLQDKEFRETLAGKEPDSAVSTGTTQARGTPSAGTGQTPGQSPSPSRLRRFLQSKIREIFLPLQKLPEKSQMKQLKKLLTPLTRILGRVEHKLAESRVGQALASNLPPAVAGGLLGLGLSLLFSPIGPAMATLLGVAGGISGKVIAHNVQNRDGAGETVKKTLPLAATTSASVSALAAAASLPFLLSAPGLALPLAATALVGALSGLSGTLSGTAMGRVRDGGVGGFLLGIIPRLFLSANPMIPLVGGISGALGAGARTPKGRAFLGAVSGLLAGAASGVIGGPLMMGISAAVGALLGVGGALLGPKMQILERNLSEDLQGKLVEKLEPLVDKAGKKGQIALAAFAGGIGMLPLSLTTGILFGPVGAALPVLFGAISTAAGIARYMKKVEEAKKAQALKNLTPPPAQGQAGLTPQGNATQPAPASP